MATMWVAATGNTGKMHVKIFMFQLCSSAVGSFNITYMSQLDLQLEKYSAALGSLAWQLQMKRLQFMHRLIPGLGKCRRMWRPLCLCMFVSLFDWETASQEYSYSNGTGCQLWFVCSGWGDLLWGHFTDPRIYFEQGKCVPERWALSPGIWRGGALTTKLFPW